MMDAKSFIEEFHGLTGNLLKERKKNLRILLDNYRSIQNNEDILKEIGAKLQPRTYLEETYKLEFLLYFKRVWELFEFLKNGSDKTAIKIIKQKWFVTTIVRDVAPKEFVTEIFPQLSLVVRLKILKQILKHFKDEKFIDSLFQELLETYGFRPALVIISGCSTEKIKNVLKDRGLKVSMAQLKLLHDKDRSIIRFYYEEYYRRGGNVASLDSFSCYLSRKDPNLYMELHIKYDFSILHKLGRQATNDYVRRNRDSIINDPVKYLDLNVLKKSVLVKQLGNDFPGFLKDAFPESFNQLGGSHIVFNLLDNYPKKKRYDLFSRLFKEVYNKDLINAKEIMTENLLETIVNHEEREKWVEVFNNEVKYIQYKRSSLAIPELKEQLFRADNVTFRKELLEYIISSCGVNEDYNALLDVLKLICKRFQNDDSVLYSAVNKIGEKMNLRKLTEEHWKYIHEIFLRQDLKNISVDGEVVLEYCEFLNRSGKSFEEMIPIYLKSERVNHTLRTKFVEIKDEKFQKNFLKLILKYYSSINEVHRTTWNTMQIIFTIKRWNHKHPYDLILVSQVKTIVEIVLKEMESTWIYRQAEEIKALKYLICGENDTDDFEHIYFQNITNLANATVTRWFLKNKPQVFEKYIDKIYACFTMESKSLTRILRKLEHLGLVKAIEDHFLEKLKELNQSEKDAMVQLLTSVMASKNYMELIEKYIPANEKLDLLKASEEEKTLLQIEMSLAKSVRFSTCHASALPIIFNYCKGDCLQPALYSLYSCFNRIPEKDLKPYLSGLLNKPVSVRKHAMFLAALAFPVCVNAEFGQEMIKNEKDASVQKHIFTNYYKYFLKNPLEQFWNILQKCIESLTIHDKESIDVITNVHNIPENYKGIFAENVWKVLEELEQKEKDAINKYYKNFFLTLNDYDVKFLAPNFCIDIINKKLFREEFKLNPMCSKFAIQFMMYSKDVKQAVESVMRILTEYKTKYWNSEKSGNAKSTVYHFCFKIFDKVMSPEYLRIVLPQNFILIFSEEWKNTFSQQETFEEYLMLEFMLLKHEKSTDLKVIAQKIGELFECARRSFGDLILDLFQNFLQTYLKQLLGCKKYESKLMEFLEYFAEEDDISSTRCLLIISLLPILRHNNDLKTKYDHVLKKIRTFPDPIISIYLNKHFKNLK